jgi:hypothetical protein
VERLRLLYGEDHFFEVASFDQGVRAVMRIPIATPVQAIATEPIDPEFHGSPLSLSVH